MSIDAARSVLGRTERVERLDIGLVCDVGVPYPVLVQSDERTFLAFRLGRRGSGTSSTIQVVVPAAAEPTRVGVIEFVGCRLASMGLPNDEALSGHRLWRRGLREVGYHSAGEVFNSSLVRDLEQGNRVHPRHQPAFFTSLRHFVFTFKECTFECVATGLLAYVTFDPLPRVLQTLATSVADGEPLPFVAVGDG